MLYWVRALLVLIYGYFPRGKYLSSTITFQMLKGYPWLIIQQLLWYWMKKLNAILSDATFFPYRQSGTSAIQTWISKSCQPAMHLFNSLKITFSGYYINSSAPSLDILIHIEQHSWENTFFLPVIHDPLKAEHDPCFKKFFSREQKSYWLLFLCVSSLPLSS